MPAMRQGLVTLSMDSAEFGALDMGFGGRFEAVTQDVLLFEKLHQGLRRRPTVLRRHVE